MEGTGKKVAIYGTGAKAYLVGRWKNLTRTAVQSSTTLRSPLHDHLPTTTLPMQMQTSTSSHHTLVSNGKVPSPFHLAKKSPTWVSAGTYIHWWCTYQTKRRPNIWQPSRSGRSSAHTTSLRCKSSMGSYSTLLWLSQWDALISPAWRPCSAPSTVILSFHTHPRETHQTTQPGGNINSGMQVSTSPSPGPTPLLSTRHTQTQALASVW